MTEALEKAGGTSTPSPPGPGRPFLSVVAIAHGRKEYLLDAVRSVLSQGIPPADVEVWVVKDYDDPAIDSQLSAWGVRQVVTAEKPLGAKVALGVRASTAEVITFLEDDDAYLPGRLPRLVELFRANPALGYYRNGQALVGADGRPLPPAAYGAAHRNLLRLGPVEASAEDLARNLPRLALVDPDFNLSSIALRRAILIPRAEELRALPAAVDSFLFYAALAHRSTVRVDPEPLTAYRVHAANTSLWQETDEAGLTRRAEYQRSFLDAFGKVYDRLREGGPLAAVRLAGSAYHGTWVLYRLLTGLGGRGALARDLGRFWRMSPASVLRYRKDLTLWGIAGLLAPARARRAFLRRRGRESSRAMTSEE